MIERIILIMGLPGSGKTTLANAMAQEGNLVIDDYGKRVLEDRLGVYGEIRAARPRRLILTDVMAVRSNPEAIRHTLRYFGADVDIIAFENDPDACWANIERRQDGRVIDRTALYGMARAYDPSRFTDTVVRVYRNS